MGKHFLYSRKASVRKKDENGKDIPLKDDQGVVIPGKFEQEEVVYSTDSFNLEKVIRTFTVNPNKLIVLLDDGHEITEVVDRRIKNPNKPPVGDNILETKARSWIQSEITIEGDDVPRYLEALQNS